MTPLKHSLNNYVNFLLPWVIVTFALNSNLLVAHEMWIEPLDFTIKPKDKIFAHNKVGQNFKGNSYAYLDKNFKHLNIHQEKFDRPVKSRLGDKPFIQETINDAGLVILSAISNGNTLTYKSEEQFRKFISAEKLNWVFKEHKKRRLPSKGFTETFIRSAKSLVKVGHGKGEDRKIGLPLEWVLQNNPYTTNEKKIVACLYWQGEKVIDKPVHIFNKTPVESVSLNKKQNTKNKTAYVLSNRKYQVTDTFLTTDDSGCVSIARNKGIHLLNAVKMIEPSDTVKNESNAVWESTWGSLTYSTIE